MIKATILGGFAMSIFNLSSAAGFKDDIGQHDAGVQCGGKAVQCDVLEVLSLGVTYDKYRQGKLWESLKKGSAFSPLREFDEAKVPWSWQDKAGQSGGRALDALENATAVIPMYWGMPSMYAGLPLSKEEAATVTGPILGLSGSAETNGMSWHLFVASHWLLSETPDRLLELAFDFFDTHPDAPLLFVSTTETPDDHDSLSSPGTPRLIRDGRYFVEIADSAVVLVLGRRERIERLRKFAWDDKDNDLGQNKIRMAYFELREKLAHPKSYYTRNLSVEEWLKETSNLAVRDDIRSAWGTWRQRKDWTPSPWFPVPWSKEQLSIFDRLPTLGYVHRPVYVTWTDANGKPVQSIDQRKVLMNEGLEKALRALKKNGQPQYPSRIIYANGGRTDSSLVLHGALIAQKANGGPDYDINANTKFIDMDRRLGKTGATTFFMQAAIGVMGSYREGGISAAINMRDQNGASILLISPPADDLREKQRHPSGGDVFRHKVEPSYDPGVYKD